MIFLDEVREFLLCVDDYGRLSGGQMKIKYGADALEGYEWLAKKARVLRKRIDEARPAAVAETIAVEGLPR